MKAGQVILTVISLFVLLSCTKNSSCETWEVNDSCSETGNCNYVGCNSYPSGIHQEEICGDALKDARPNNTITINSNCTTRQRTFLRKL